MKCSTRNQAGKKAWGHLQELIIAHLRRVGDDVHYQYALVVN